MSESTPKKMSLRCYGYRTRHGTWIASCIDLSLMVERPSKEESIEALLEQMMLYVESAIDAKDVESISYLLPRPAPVWERLLYQVLSAACRFERFCSSAFKFKKEYIIPQAA